ncbi:MAG: metal-dependent transcriptional regulator [Anaerolineales bacterium]|nr:metal-dependent transcriptional regulator [Anaerolineales bacterium]
MKSSKSVQDYLKRVYELTEGGAPANTNDLARELNVKPASVTGMIQKLAAQKPPLVQYQKHQGVTLTPSGRRAALEVIRHHRLLETWLVQTLGYAWDEVHEEAERLEHVISEDLERRIDAALGHPTHDPHGDPIPSADLKIPPDDSIPLSALKSNRSAVVQRVASQDAALLRHLDQLGLVPGVQIAAGERSPFDNNLVVVVKKKTRVLGLSVTSKIFVKENN